MYAGSIPTRASNFPSGSVCYRHEKPIYKGFLQDYVKAFPAGGISVTNLFLGFNMLEDLFPSGYHHGPKDILSQ